MLLPGGMIVVLDIKAGDAKFAGIRKKSIRRIRGILVPDHIDYTQYSKWQFCAWAWYERYILKRQKKWPEGLRDDALCIGSLVHSGLENWYAKQSTEISQKVIERVTPTPEALRLCQRLIHGYISTFPREQWELIRCEDPLRFALIEGRDGLAKLDLYFYIPTPTRVESGIVGYEITLKPGWWIQEYKTKSPYVPVGDFMQSWVTNMQADFQMLALQAKFDQGPQVNGLLINVIEKPKDYIPKRKCKKCEEYYAYSSWSADPNVGGNFTCPVCGNSQKLKPVEMKEQSEAQYFRMVVERTPKQLERSKFQIKTVAEQMQAMPGLVGAEKEHRRITTDNHYFDLVPPNKENCFNLSRRYAKECEFFKPHTYGFSTVGHQDYQETENYIGTEA